MSERDLGGNQEEQRAEQTERVRRSDREVIESKPHQFLTVLQQ